MPRSNDPWYRTWKQISEDIRDVQGTVDSYKKRFEAAERKDIAGELEQCILHLIAAETAAQELDLKDRGVR
jgi:hypothetical protein